MDRARHIQEESDRLGAVLAGCDPAAAVPSCPGWTALDLLSHVVTVQRFWAAVLGQRLDDEQVADYERSPPPLPRDRSALLVLRREATADLVTALVGRDPAEAAWSWFSADRTVDFSWRMQTHEALMHRVDAELAAGRAISPLSPELAADGIDHVVDVMWNWVPDSAERRTTGVVRLSATDSGRRWSLRTCRWSATAWGQTFTDHPGCHRTDDVEPDAVVSGTAHDLDLLVWGRGDRRITRVGDAEVLGELQAVLDDGIH